MSSLLFSIIFLTFVTSLTNGSLITALKYLTPFADSFTQSEISLSAPSTLIVPL
jgi:hypothetical protein